MGSWQLEVFKMATYMIFPMGLWYGFNSDYYQNNYFLPYLKENRPDVYNNVYGEDDE